MSIDDVEVADGFFTVALDYGEAVFDGKAPWLKVAVRESSLTEPDDYVTLLPRQPVTVTPYALQTRDIIVDEQGDVGISTNAPGANCTKKTFFAKGKKCLLIIKWICPIYAESIQPNPMKIQSVEKLGRGTLPKGVNADAAKPNVCRYRSRFYCAVSLRL